jgi:hypothetical protein
MRNQLIWQNNVSGIFGVWPVEDSIPNPHPFCEIWCFIVSKTLEIRPLLGFVTPIQFFGVDCFPQFFEQIVALLVRGPYEKRSHVAPVYTQQVSAFLRLYAQVLEPLGGGYE